MAGLGKKVLLVECDVRRRTLVEYFRAEPRPGLVSVLAGNSRFEDAVYHDPEIDCDILFADTPNINAADLFSSERFKTFLDEKRAQYDMVVLDTPPVLIVSDARVIGKLADAILFVVRWDKTSRKEVLEGIRSLESLGLKVTGLVLSRISRKGLRQYGDGRGRHRQSDSYYEH